VLASIGSVQTTSTGLIRSATGPQRTGAASLKNQAVESGCCWPQCIQLGCSAAMSFSGGCL